MTRNPDLERQRRPRPETHAWHGRAHDFVHWFYERPIILLGLAFIMVGFAPFAWQVHFLQFCLAAVAVWLSWKIRLGIRLARLDSWHEMRTARREHRSFDNWWDRHVIREDWAHICAEAGLKRAPTLVNYRSTLTGEEWTAQMAQGLGAKALIDTVAPHIAARHHVIESGVTFPGNNVFVLKFRTKEPFANGTAKPKAPAPEPDKTREVAEPVAIGVNENRGVEYADLAMHLLAGGSTQSGKTNLFRLLLSALVQCVNGRLYLIDPAGDIARFRHAAFAYSRGTADEALEIIRAVHAELKRRAKLAEDRDERIELTAELPLIVLAIDEYPGVAKRVGKDGQMLLDDIAQEGVKHGVILWAACTHPKDSELSTTVKNNLLQKAAFSTETVTASNVILGPGMSGEGFDASTITRQGLCYWKPARQRPRLVQCYQADKTTERNVLRLVPDPAPAAQTAQMPAQTAQMPAQPAQPGDSSAQNGPYDPQFVAQIVAEVVHKLRTTGAHEGVVHENIQATTVAHSESSPPEIAGDVEAVRIWRTLREQGPMSKPELIELTGYGRMTVARRLDKLKGLGLAGTDNLDGRWFAYAAPELG